MNVLQRPMSAKHWRQKEDEKDSIGVVLNDIKLTRGKIQSFYDYNEINTKAKKKRTAMASSSNRLSGFSFVAVSSFFLSYEHHFNIFFGWFLSHFQSRCSHTIACFDNFSLAARLFNSHLLLSIRKLHVLILLFLHNTPTSLETRFNMFPLEIDAYEVQ